jgi:hypothetical protein
MLFLSFDLHSSLPAMLLFQFVPLFIGFRILYAQIQHNAASTFCPSLRPRLVTDLSLGNRLIPPILPGLDGNPTHRIPPSIIHPHHARQHILSDLLRIDILDYLHSFVVDPRACVVSEALNSQD